MKLLVSIWIAAAGLLFNGAEAGDEIIAALRQGKASELVKYFDERVSIRIINQEDVLSKSQAEANLRYFFEKHPVKGFIASAKSSPNNNSQFISGLMETTNGKYRVSVLLRRGLVSQLRIENDNE
jgi:hypothetical protein